MLGVDSDNKPGVSRLRCLNDDLLVGDKAGFMW